MARSKRRSLVSALLAVLIPQPIMAFESGVNAMEAVNDVESKSVFAWAYNEIRELETGFRSLLDPIIPPVQQTFSVLDLEIARFIADGKNEEIRLQEVIDNITSTENPQQEEITGFDISTPVQHDSPDFYNYVQNFQPIDFGVNDQGRFALDTEHSVNLPDLTIDPRNGGEYYSDMPVVQSALDIIQEAQNQVPAPIQSLGTETYNSVLEAALNVNRSS